jgi:hypothetical protein
MLIALRKKVYIFLYPSSCEGNKKYREGENQKKICVNRWFGVIFFVGVGSAKKSVYYYTQHKKGQRINDNKKVEFIAGPRIGGKGNGTRCRRKEKL